MALAYLKYEGFFNDSHRFSYDLGSNAYYTIGFGNETRNSRQTRLKFIDDVFYSTPLKRIENLNLGRGRIISIGSLERQAYVQMISYTTSKAGCYILGHSTH